jgi:hypothetical protein
MAQMEGSSSCAPSKGCRPIGDRCAKDPDCCTPGMGACGPDETGTLRCLGPGGSEPSCLGAGSACALSEQCCAGRCLPDSTGALACGGACAPLGAACNGDEDCCAGACLGPADRSVCAVIGAATGGPTCTPAGQACDPMAATCCANTVCSTVVDGSHACAPVTEL